MNPRRALVVDDERLARRRLRKLLDAHPRIELAAEAEDVSSAIEALERDPGIDLVFLDIQMPGGSGFELFSRAQPAADVVFVTAHDEHALRAFDVGAVDYLLKPIDPARLAQALAKLDARGRHQDARICLPTTGGARFVPLDALVCVRAEGDYTEVCLRTGERELVRVPLKDWERRLPPESFIRVHRSALVGLAAIRRLCATEGSTHALEVDGIDERIPVSRTQLRAVRSALGL